MRQALDSMAGAGLIFVHMLMGPFLKGWRRRWGARPDERAVALPDGTAFEHDAWAYTRAVSIAAPPDAVWPWIVQIGQGRGGFYSYEGLENLLGCQIRNTSRIEPAFQELREGDPIFLHPHTPPLHVAAIEPGRLLYLLSEPTETAEDGPRAAWMFELVPEGPGCRLILRGLHAYGRHMADRLVAGPVFLDPISFVMERKMLRNIRRLAESGMPDLRKYGVTTR